MSDRSDFDRSGTDGQDPAAELLARWQQDGDTEALDRLLRLEVGILKGMIGRRGAGILGASAGVTDVAQEAVLGLLKAGTTPTFDHPKALRAYLWTAAWRLLLQRLKRKGRRSVPLEPGESRTPFEEAMATTGGLGKVEEDDRALALRVTLSLMKPAEREILDLVYLRQQDVATAAASLGITKDAANMRLVRARRRMAAKLADWSELIG